MTTKKSDIHKAGGILIKNKKVLVARSKDKDHFVIPGGKVENRETPLQAIIRELYEELDIHVAEKSVESFGVFFGKSETNKELSLRMDVFTIRDWRGVPKASNEISEILWINSVQAKTIYLGSIMQEEIIPRLKQQQQID